MIVVHTSIAFVNILVSLNGIFSGNFSLVIATSKKREKQIFYKVLAREQTNLQTKNTNVTYLKAITKIDMGDLSI